MKSSNAILLGIAGLVAYKVISDKGGGGLLPPSAPGAAPAINLSMLGGTTGPPNIDLGGIGGGFDSGGLVEYLKSLFPGSTGPGGGESEAEAKPEPAKEPGSPGFDWQAWLKGLNPDAPAPEAGAPDIIDWIKNAAGGGGVDTAGTGLDLFGKLKDAFNVYTGDTTKGLSEGIDFFSWITGGWQDKNSLVASFQERGFGYKYPWSLKRQGELTEYAKNILAKPPAEVMKAAATTPTTPSGRAPFSGGRAPTYTPLSPTPHPGIPGVSIVGVLRGSSTPIGSIGTKPPPTKAERWMFT